MFLTFLVPPVLVCEHTNLHASHDLHLSWALLLANASELQILNRHLPVPNYKVFWLYRKNTPLLFKEKTDGNAILSRSWKVGNRTQRSEPALAPRLAEKIRTVSSGNKIIEQEEMSHNVHINLWQTSRNRWKEGKRYSKRHSESTYSPCNSQLRTEGKLTRSTLGIELNNLLNMCVKLYTLTERRKENKIPCFDCLMQVFRMHACLSLYICEGQEGTDA